MAGSLPVVMAVPPPAMARGSGRSVVWFTGGCCAPVTVCARLFRGDRVVVVQRHASGHVSNHGEAYTTNGFLDVPF